MKRKHPGFIYGWTAGRGQRSHLVPAGQNSRTALCGLRDLSVICLGPRTGSKICERCEDYHEDALADRKDRKRKFGQNGSRTHCIQPDRDVPGIVCGYPLPCPHHTVVLNAQG